MRRPQFSLKTLLVLMLPAACFFGGIRFERERRRREDEAAAEASILAEADRLAKALAQNAAKTKELERVNYLLRSAKLPPED